MDTEQKKRPASRAPSDKGRGPGKATPRRQAPPADARDRKAGQTPPARRTSRPAEGTPRRQRPAAQEPPRRTRPQNGQARRPAKPSERRPRPKRAAPRRPREEAPEIVYTPPKPFSRNRFLLQLVSVVAVVLAVTFGLSIFFRVKHVTVSGADLYTPWQIREASGIVEGDSLLSFGKAKASGRIRAKLPYIESVRIGIKLPDTVNIGIVETEVVYAIQANDNTWWCVSASGRVVEPINPVDVGNYTKVVGLRLSAPAVNEQAAAASASAAEPAVTAAPTQSTSAPSDPSQPSTSSDPSQPSAPPESTPVTVTGEERLAATLEILQALEDNGFVGEVTGVDVGDMQNIQLWYGTRYEVLLGDSTNLSYKIQCIRQAVNQMPTYQSGTLDASFTTWPDQIGFTPGA